MPVKHSKTVHSALKLLECFTSERPSMTLTHLTRLLGMPKSNVHRLAATLESAGYLRRDAVTGEYLLGYKLIYLGEVAKSNLNIAEIGRALIRALRDETGETAHLAVLDDLEVVYIDKVDSDNPVRAYTTLGSRAPAHAVASGLAMLAYEKPEKIERLIARGLQPYTEMTITDPRALRAKLLEIRERGVAVNPGGLRKDVLGIAAPVFDAQGRPVASVGVSMPVFYYDEQGESAAECVRRIAAEFSKRLGYQGSG